MAPVDKKRKARLANESFARSRKPAFTDTRPPKRQRKESEHNEDKSIQEAPSALNLSKARDEEVAFPRGGGSVLTPLEHKQIQIEATRDVLFEQQEAKSAQKEGGNTAPLRKHSKTKGKRKPSIKSDEPSELESVKIEGLSYKRIVQGSLVLGQVMQINDHDVALSLPNNLTGYVPITSISDKITQRIEAITAMEGKEDKNGEDQEELSEDDVDLDKLFFLGQYLRGFVVSTSDESKETTSTKAKRRIELSLQPRQANNTLSPQDLVTHSTLMASVVSVEDHGLIMDLGMDDPDIRGFMSSKEVGQSIELSKIEEGTVFLCTVTGLSSNGKIVKLSADTQKTANPKKLNYLTDAPTIDTFLPGTAIEILVTDVSPKGIAGKVMGMLDVTADLMHSGAVSSDKDLEKKYKIGSKIKGRIVCNFPTADPPKLGVSLLDHVMSLTQRQTLNDGEKQNPLDILPLSSIVEEVTVLKVEPGIGLVVNVGIKGVHVFVHISMVKDGKIETLSASTGPFKVGTVHRGRVTGYNSLDGVYIVSFKQSVLEQPFLRIEDVKVGEVVKGTIEKLVFNPVGVGGVLVNLAEGISGLVPEAHMADVQLLHPEKKFKEGMKVTARVLSTNPGKRQIRLTLKKSLVNSEATPFISYDEISVGMQSPGTIINILSDGAVVQFYGSIRGFLPVSEMSEAYIEDPKEHFRIGQVVNVHVLKVDPQKEKLSVSCKDPSVFGLAQQNALKKLQVGETVTAAVTEINTDSISVEIQETGLRAFLPIGHLTDGSESKNNSALKKIRVGQTLTDLMVLEKREEKKSILLTNKPSLLKDAKDGNLLKSFEDVKEKKTVHGFVNNVTPTAVFVQFGGGLTGLLPEKKLSEEALLLPDFGVRKHQSIKVNIFSVDPTQRRFVLSMKDNEKKVEEPAVQPTSISSKASNPVDDTIKSVEDFHLGRLTKAKVVSVKKSQINVQLASNIQGRVDVSQVFDSWEEIKDRKRPLRSFSTGQVINVRILGIHDARNHRFLPISHRAGTNAVFELSTKPSDQTEEAQEHLTLDKVTVGSSWIAFVNNIADDCLWVNLSPNVRGRVRTLDVSDDISLLSELESNFPIGSAIKVHATAADVVNNRLDLSARSPQTSTVLTFDNITKNRVLPGKVTKVNERQVMVQLSEKLSAPIHLTDLSDDFSEANPSIYSKHDIVHVCIIDIDKPNKKLRLSTRPSRVLNSSSRVQDRESFSISQIQVGEVIRGFIKNVSDKGLFVNLGGDVTGYVRVAELSDSYIKDWKSEYQVDQLVKGKVIAVDSSRNHIQLSLKASILDKNYTPPLRFNDIKVGQIVTGKVRKVEDFGVFIVIDGSANVSGLCHQSEMAEKRVHDVKKLYEEGDSVKAIVLKLDQEKRRISFGLKASYFEDAAADSEDDGSDAMKGVKVGSEDDGEEDDSDGGVDLNDVESITSIQDQNVEATSDEEMEDADEVDNIPALNAGGFDWNANILNQISDDSAAGSEDEVEKPKKKKPKKAEIQIDRTGDLDANGPQSVSDFERLLLGQPDSSQLWTAYMAFQINLSELGKAREIAERAIKTINMREDTEKMNMWIALLNLEVTYGSDESVEEVFKRACQYNDAQEIHERLASIYIHAGKHEKADSLFQTTTKTFSQNPTIWYNYAHFLHTTLQSPDRARLLLPRAIQSLPTHTHLPLTLKFASLEFHSPYGSPERGRTMFEGILTTYPKRLDIWNQLLNLELGQPDNKEEEIVKGMSRKNLFVRGLFERVTGVKGLKARGAKDWFRRWSMWEEEHGDRKSQESVRVRAEEWVKMEAERKRGEKGEGDK